MTVNDRLSERSLPSYRTLRSGIVAVALASLLLTGCAAGKDAVAVGGTFTFVAPGGQSVIVYDPPAARGQVRGFSGDELVQPTRSVALSDFPRQVVVLNIWGSWCGPCRAEAPDLEEAYQSTKGKGVAFLGVDVRDDQSAAADFVRDRRVTYPSIFDPAGRTLNALSGFPRNTVPATLVLDRQRRVAAVFLTRIRASQLVPVIQRVAAETEPDGGRDTGSRSGVNSPDQYSPAATSPPPTADNPPRGPATAHTGAW